ncbi:hypothetical protein C464_10463 [Halorubrum coriense DSM 10284]|uniref:YdbS-like PH domain-containing protein n=1 Tax=Halorubrum coriense DSM 10284 TaxID=1227466 RepID=M0EHU0_9EURY|nr:hypothetical protein C464_10463 [Halorubrum coriense DSM 10284]
MRHEAGTAGINVMDGESVLQNRHPGWGLWWKQLSVAALILLFSLSSGLDGLLGGLIVAGAVVGYVAFARSQSRYIVTDERVKKEVGFLRIDTREYRISDIQGIDTAQSLVGRLLGHGHIDVRTSDGTSIPWVGVPDHEAVAQSVRTHQRKYDSSMDRK